MEGDDVLLLAAWRAGDRGAGERLLGRYFDAVARFFRSKLGDDVEDLIQATFADCVAANQQVRGPSFRAYLFTIARNRLFDHLRTAFRRPQGIDLDAISIADLGTSPSGKLARREEYRQLLDALRHLPVEQQV